MTYLWSCIDLQPKLTRKLGTVCFHGRYLKRTCRSLHAVDGRNPAPVEVGILSHYLQGFIHPRWLAVSRIASINRSLPKIPSHPEMLWTRKFPGDGLFIARSAEPTLQRGRFPPCRPNPPLRVGEILPKSPQKFWCHANFFCRHMSLHFTCNMSFGQQICDVLCILFFVEFHFWLYNFDSFHSIQRPGRCWLWTAEPLSHVALGGSNGSNGGIKVGVA